MPPIIRKEVLFLCELSKSLGYTVLCQAIVIEQVVLHNQMPVAVEQRNVVTLFVNGTAVDFISAIILAEM